MRGSVRRPVPLCLYVVARQLFPRFRLSFLPGNHSCDTVIHMKVKFIGHGSPLSLLEGKEYEVVSIECGWFRIVDETEEDYLYPPEQFEVTEVEPCPPVLGPPRKALVLPCWDNGS